jgi:hypothetical protein
MGVNIGSGGARVSTSIQETHVSLVPHSVGIELVPLLNDLYEDFVQRYIICSAPRLEPLFYACDSSSDRICERSAKNSTHPSWLSPRYYAVAYHSLSVI